jgi:small-conductance mechanosensitive channel
MSETFNFDVAFDTSFEDLERLRERMLEFLNRERRDFLPSFDVFVVGGSYFTFTRYNHLAVPQIFRNKRR